MPSTLVMPPLLAGELSVIPLAIAKWSAYASYNRSLVSFLQPETAAVKATVRLLTLFALASGLLLAGCDSSGEDDSTQVTCEVTGNNVSSISYGTGESGADAAEQVQNPDLPWNFTVDDSNREAPVFTVSAITEEEGGGSVRVAVLVNGDERDSDSASGSLATASASVTLQ